jgi:hypothetical protein
MSSTNKLIAGKDPEERPAPPHFEGQDRDTLIAELTLRKWEKASKPRGQWEVFWLEAEQEVLTVTFWMDSPAK